jgi:8-oxo-dGTP pyrophosphatase MutT (NUDIX family)
MNCYAAYVLIIVERDNKVLLLKRSTSAEFGANAYSLIGGKVEACEMLIPAAIRETFEEVGITIEQKDLHYVHTCNKSSETIMIIGVFRATQWQGNPFNKEPEKHDDMQWFSYDALPNDLLPTHKMIIEAVQRKKIFSESYE